MSLGPPGVNPTTKRTGFSGNPWADDVVAAHARVAAINAHSRVPGAFVPVW
jgi:hypothetical protein